MISSVIIGLEEEIETLLERYKNYTLISPLSGIVLDIIADISEIDTNGTFVHISDTSSYVAIIPLQLNVLKFVSPQQEVEFELLGSNSTLHGRILKLGNVVSIIENDQIIIATAIIDAQNEELIPGTMAKCKIICEPVTLLEYLSRAINIVINR